MRMVGDDDVGAHLEVSQIAVPGIGRGDRGEFFSAVRDDDASIAFAEGCKVKSRLDEATGRTVYSVRKNRGALVLIVR